MKQFKLLLILMLLMSGLSATAAELGSSGSGHKPAFPQPEFALPTPGIIAKPRFTTPNLVGYFLNPNFDSIRAAAHAAYLAVVCTQAQRKSLSSVCGRIDESNGARSENITDFTGYHVYRSGQASCYGTPKDGFGYDPKKMHTNLGLKFIPNNMTAACPRPLNGKMVIVVDNTSHLARKVTCSDTGGFGSLGRVIDLSVGVFKSFGLGCGLRNVTVYAPNN